MSNFIWDPQKNPYISIHCWGFCLLSLLQADADAEAEVAGVEERNDRGKVG